MVRCGAANSLKIVDPPSAALLICLHVRPMLALELSLVKHAASAGHTDVHSPEYLQTTRNAWSIYVTFLGGGARMPARSVCPQCLPGDVVPIRSWTRTLRRPGIRHRHLPYHTIPPYNTYTGRMALILELALMGVGGGFSCMHACTALPQPNGRRCVHTCARIAWTPP